MTLRKVLVLLFAAFFILPLCADDFDDDFGDFDDFDDGGKKESSFDDDFDAEDSAARKAKQDQKASKDAMRDLLGDEDEFAEEPLKEEVKEKEFSDWDEPKKEEKKAEAASPKEKGFRPVLLIKGGFTPFGQYKEYVKGETVSTTNQNSMFGGVDEGLLGVEFIGDYVIAKGTMNVRTDNPFINKGNNPLAKANLRTIQNGVVNGLYELYGGVKFYGVFIKAGKMLPEYGLVDTYQTIGMGFTTPYLTRSLVAVEGFIPETDAGLSIGYRDTFAKAHTIFAGLTLGTGTVISDVWSSDRTVGIYGRVGYGFKDHLQAAFGFQYRTDFYDKATKSKKAAFIGIGIHLKAAVKGFEMPFTFDFNRMDLYTASGAKKKGQSMLLSLAPGYAYSFKNSNWADKIGLAVRFDLVRGVYTKGANYLDYGNISPDNSGSFYEGFKNESMVYRIGVTANFFAKEFKGVHSFAGITFLTQPANRIVTAKGNVRSENDFGIMTLMLSAGAEM